MKKNVYIGRRLSIDETSLRRRTVYVINKSAKHKREQPYYLQPLQ